MSSIDDPAGDVPIDFETHLFTLADASIITRVGIKSVRNWMDRAVLPTIGRKDAISGRWLFNIYDCVKLAVVHDLVVRSHGGFLTHEAGWIAGLVVDGIAQVMQQQPDHRPCLNLLVGWREDGEIVAEFHSIEGPPGHYYPPARLDDDGYQPLRRPHMVIPIWPLLADVVLRTEQLGKVNMRAEAPVHV